jgi:hypothetical protein
MPSVKRKRTGSDGGGTKKKRRTWVGPDGPSNFLMQSAGPHARRPIQRLSEALLGRGAVDQDFTFAFREEGQLPRFTARRVDVTAAKFMYTIAILYAAGVRNPLLVVEGAKLQTGTGNSARVGRGGVSYLTGHEAAHFGIGTFTLQGQAVSEWAQERIRGLAASRRIGPADIPTKFEANGYLTVHALVHDADTYVAPAFFNRTEGLQEVARQHCMLGLLPVVIPETAERLEAILSAAGERVVTLLAASHRAVVKPIEARLRDLTTGTAKEFLQDPHDTANRVFNGRERDALTAMLDMVQGHGPAGAEYQGEIRAVRSRIFDRARDLAELAEAAREEQKEA